ncbi:MULTISPECIES: hypothetical protein [Erythrobacter]|uniref:Uncharacterized protein n=1 Tax=Erythrobacter aureus TaxID=2182384 RepID=A0A345YBA7_9SPHN|nr:MULTISPECIES: hypothetical protein [Erythrobacter]AXK41209.1 hypothetical protein DVR09_01715 [Erythrobacter aureus]MBQ94495.1 hypothetical protein [Actinomycetota bacterium]MCF8882861.1 hypothetical protein [Erythrobacter sp. SN021]
MIDYLALGLTHALILIGILRVIARDELDREDPPGAEIAEGKPKERAARRARRERGQASDA